MFYIPKIREKLIQSQLLKEQKFYEEYPIEQIEKYQIQEFNKLWKDIIKHVQYYKKLVEEKNYLKVLNRLTNLKIFQL